MDPSFGEKGRKFVDMVSEISSRADICELAALILQRLLGHKGLLYDAVKLFKPQEFIPAISELISDHYMISSKTVGGLRDHFRKMKYVMHASWGPGPNMKEYLKALQLLSTQIHCDGMAHNGTPDPTFRYMLQKLVGSTNTRLATTTPSMRRYLRRRTTSRRSRRLVSACTPTPRIASRPRQRRSFQKPTPMALHWLGSSARRPTAGASLQSSLGLTVLRRTRSDMPEACASSCFYSALRHPRAGLKLLPLISHAESCSR
jgi:hypothetical protein